MGKIIYYDEVFKNRDEYLVWELKMTMICYQLMLMNIELDEVLDKLKNKNDNRN